LIERVSPDDAAGQSLRHVVIDGGRKATWPHLKRALEGIAARGEEVELLVLSHIDADHIDGLLAMVEAAHVPLTPKAVWYNGHDQIAQVKPPPGTFGPSGVPAAERYGKALDAKGWAINEEFGGKPLSIEGNAAPIEVAGLSLTLVSPDRAKLWKLRKEWNKALIDADLAPLAKRRMPEVLDVERLSAPSAHDSTAPNGSSIAFIAEHGGRRLLLGADAHPDIMEASLTRLAGADGKVTVDLVKLPHHGSRANFTRELVEKLDCRRFAISTSGAVFGHPDPEAIARILKFGDPRPKIFYFNYASERTQPWNDDKLKNQWQYDCVYAEKNMPLAIDI
jgi:hypothetical protein